MWGVVMRLTVEQAINKGLIGDVRVKLNGIYMNECIRACEENEVVEINRPDLHKPGMGFCPTQVLKGKVQILLGDRM